MLVEFVQIRIWASFAERDVSGRGAEYRVSHVLKDSDGVREGCKELRGVVGFGLEIFAHLRNCHRW